MTAPPYLPRQLELLSRMMPVSRNPICLTVYDTQGVAPLIMYLAGFEGAYEEIRDGVAWFRMTNYLPTGEKLVDRIRDAAESTSLIFLHVGGTQLPDSVLHLLEFIASQSFAVPRIIVVCEALDVACGNDNLRTLFSRVGSHLDLRAGGHDVTDRRLDLSGYRAPESSAVIGDPIANAAAGALEGFWDKSSLPTARPYGSEPDGDRLAYWLQAHLAKPDGIHASIALIDWTSLLHVAELFDGSLRYVDPFVALADLSAVLAAVLFHDRVLVIDGDQSDVMHRASTALGVEGVITSLPSNGGPRDGGGNSVFEWTLTDCFQGAAAILHNLDADAPLRTDLRDGWKRILPGAPQPSSYQVNDLHWSTSPARPDLHRQLFQRSSTLNWKPAAADLMIIDNDVRAFTYERMAGLMTSSLASDWRSGPTVRYVGGVLRAPMQRAMRRAWRRSWASMQPYTYGPAAENALNGWWTATQNRKSHAPALPFWFAAVLHQVVTPADFAEVVPQWREKGAAFRRSRAGFEAALADGNPKVLDAYQQAMTGALDKFAESRIAETALGAIGKAATAGVALTGIPILSDVLEGPTDAAAKRIASPVARWTLRASRPRLWFVSRFSDAATGGLRLPSRRLGEIFSLPPGDKSVPLDFLNRVNALEWAV